MAYFAASGDVIVSHADGIKFTIIPVKPTKGTDYFTAQDVADIAAAAGTYAVRYDMAQTGITDAQKAQARENIGAAEAYAFEAAKLYGILYGDTLAENGTVTVEPDYVNNAVNGNTGAIGNANSARITNRTLIYVPEGASLNISVDTGTYYFPDRYCFDKSGAFLSRVQSASASLAAGTYYVRLLLMRRDGGDISIATAQSALTVTLTRATAEDRIDAFAETVPDTVVGTIAEVGANKYNPDTRTTGKYIHDGAGNLHDGSYFTSDFIDVSDFTHGYAFTPKARKILFYDANKAGIAASFLTNETAAGVLTLNSSYKYMRLSWENGSANCMVCDAATLPEYEPYELIAKDGIDYLNADTASKLGQFVEANGKYLMLSRYLSGKKILCFGDSIMYGAENGAAGPTDMLATKYGATSLKYAVSGSTMGVRTDSPTYTADEVHHIAKQVRNAIAANVQPDLIVLNGGTNDIGGGITIGSMTEAYTQPAAESYFADGFETVAYLLKSNFVGVPVIYMRAHNMSSRSYQGQIDYGELGNRIAEKWGFGTVDMYKLMNTQIAAWRTAYLADYTHPNQAGYETFYIPALENYIYANLIE